jgi:hypothetical protein
MSAATSSRSAAAAVYRDADDDSLIAPARELVAGRRAAVEFFAAIGVYAVASLLFFGRSLFGGMANRYIGREADPTVMMWLFEWWPHAIAHHLNLFLTDVVWAPVGFNLASMTSIPLLAIIAYPFTRTLGLVPAYNIVILAAPAASALCAFGLCRQVTGKFWPALLGGYLFGFSGYMLGQMLGHLCLVMVFAFPLAAWIVATRLQGKLRAGLFVALLALTLVAQFLIDLELFATGVMFGTAMLAAIIYYAPPAERRRYYDEVPLLGSALLAALVVVSPYIYYFMAFSRLKQPFWPAENYSTDLVNFFLPTSANLLGLSNWALSASSRFPARLMEQGGYIALPIFVVALLWARRNWHRPVCKALITLLAAGCVATLGPWLHIGGNAMSLLPWLALVRAPLLEHVLPARLMVIVSLLVAVIASLWMAEAEVSARSKAAIAALAIALMLPNPHAAFWSSPVDTPAFFTNRDYSRYLSTSDVVLTLPWGQLGGSMLWQAECGMCFRNVGGWTGVQRFSIRRWPIIDYLLGAHDLEDVDLQFKAFLANTGVNVVLVNDGDADAARWTALAKSLGVPPVEVSGVSLYRIPSGLLDSYRAMSGLEMESRANRARFETALRAVSRYLDAGYAPAELSIKRLVDLALLPANWKRKDEAMADAFVIAMGRDQFAIAEYGSYEALRPIVNSYRSYATAIYYPFPQVLWESNPPPLPMRLVRTALIPPASGPVDGESMQVLAIQFTREQLTHPTSMASPPREPAVVQ